MARSLDGLGGPDWEIKLSRRLAAGAYTLRIELIPSTDNCFGPHHYMLGDSHLISPVRFRAIRNFADPPGLLPCTHIHLAFQTSGSARYADILLRAMRHRLISIRSVGTVKIDFIK